VKAYEPEEFSGDTRWILNAYPVDGKEWEKFQNSGLQQIPKEDAEGKKFIRFRRSVRRVFPKDDEATYWNPPEITGAFEVHYVDAETKEKIKTFKRSEKRKIETVGEQIAIGNGSVGIVNLAVYDSGKGKGHRWESLRILDLVEYNPDAPKSGRSDESSVPNEVEKSKKETLEKETTDSKGKKSTKSDPSMVKEDMNDDIPW